jgi:GNAT superfamily N-acetyltransferase
MTASAISSLSREQNHIRPINPLRDLGAIADLVEICFHGTIDRSGQRYIQNMRAHSADSAYSRWAVRTADALSLPTSGFVWEEDGRIVGNASLMMFNRQGKRIGLVANVATHPEFRRRGIGKALTEAAVKLSQEKKAHQTWLHVREDNPGAIQLYEQIGFKTMFSRSAWQSSGNLPAANAPAAVQVLERSANDWNQHAKWLEQSYPSATAWYFSYFWNIFQPGLWNSFSNFLSDLSIRHLIAWEGNRPSAGLSMVSRYGISDNLWLASPKEPSDEVIRALLVKARRLSDPHRTLSLEFPSSVCDEAIRSVGFTLQRTLLWMRYK